MCHLAEGPNGRLAPDTAKPIATEWRDWSNRGVKERLPPVSKAAEYRAALADEATREPYALAHSGLPGPRANLELIGVLAEISSEPTLRRWADLTETEAPGDQPAVILVAAGIVGLGRFIDSRPDVFALLHDRARDARWRVREAVAIALQNAGAADPAGSGPAPPAVGRGLRSARPARRGGCALRAGAPARRGGGLARH